MITLQTTGPLFNPHSTPPSPLNFFLSNNRNNDMLQIHTENHFIPVLPILLLTYVVDKVGP